MAITNINTEEIERGLLKALRADLDIAFEEVIQKAKEELEIRLKEKTASLAMELHRFYSIEKRENETIITVKNSFLS